jgi:DNA primase small subunit
VPTVTELLGQIDQWQNPIDSEGDEGKSIQDWEKTSLKPYVDYLRSFVVALIREENGVKIKRERDETAPSAEAMEF